MTSSNPPSPSSTLYDFGVQPVSRFAKPPYEHHLMPVGWRARFQAPGHATVSVKTSRVGLIGVTVVMPYPVRHGVIATVNVDLPSVHVCVPPVPITIEGSVSACVLRGQEGFCVHVVAQRFTNPEHRRLLDRYMNDRQGLMVFLPT